MAIDDFIKRFLEDSFIIIGAEFDIIDVMMVLFWSIVLSFIIAITYRGTHTSVSYSHNFTQTLVLLGIIVSIIMLIIGSNIARAFTLVGALSIVRFRSAIKDARDLGFIFFTMAMNQILYYSNVVNHYMLSNNVSHEYYKIWTKIFSSRSSRNEFS